MPAQLLGDWFLPPSAVEPISGYPCPSPPTAASCFFQLTLTATTFNVSFTVSSGRHDAGQGNVVVDNNAIDFFNGVVCGRMLPDGVGRYTWTLAGGVLSFTLISDPCNRPPILTHPGWGRTA